MSFEIGQRVVCVDVDFGRKPNWRSKVRLFPELHKVYTIRDICEQDGLAGLFWKRWSIQKRCSEGCLMSRLSITGASAPSIDPA